MKKLKKILLINWLYFSKEIIEIGDINFLTGKNGAGKSTVIDALQIVLLGETNARNFNQAANEKSQRTLDGYLRADMDENNPYSRRGKDFSSYIACEFLDDVVGSSFVTGVVFDCRSDGSRLWRILKRSREKAGMRRFGIRRYAEGYRDPEDEKTSYRFCGPFDPTDVFFHGTYDVGLAAAVLL